MQISIKSTEIRHDNLKCNERDSRSHSPQRTSRWWHGKLHQWLQTAEGQQFAEKVTQPAPQPPAQSKYNFTIGNITAHEIQYGDRIYNGTDSETLRNLITSLQEAQTSASSATPEIAVRKILVLAASPEDQVRLNLEEEVREIDQALQLGSHRDQFDLEQRWGVNRRDLQNIMLRIKPDIIHFCGHGAKEHGLVLQNENQKAELVSNDALAELFDIFTSIKPIPCIVLNACYSETQVNAINPFIDYIVGMKKEIGDKAAIEFSRGFYRSLSNGLPYEAAFRFGKNAIALDQIPEDLTPVLQGKATQK